MSTDTHSIADANGSSQAGDGDPAPPSTLANEASPSIKSKAPNSLIQLKQDLTAWLLMERAEIREMGKQDIFNKQQIVKLTGRGLTTIKLAIKKGLLKSLPSGWVTKPQLIEYLGYDPIQAKIDKVVFYEKEIRRLTSEIERIILHD